MIRSVENDLGRPIWAHLAGTILESCMCFFVGSGQMASCTTSRMEASDVPSSSHHLRSDLDLQLQLLTLLGH